MGLTEEEMKEISKNIADYELFLLTCFYINQLLKDRYNKGFDDCYKRHTESELGNEI